MNKNDDFFQNKRNLHIFELVFCLAALFGSLRMIDIKVFDNRNYYLCLIFVSMGLADLSKAFYLEQSQKSLKRLNIAYAALYFCSIPALILIRSNSSRFRMMSFIIALIFAINRIVSLKRKHKALNKISFAASCLLLLIFCIALLIRSEKADKAVFLFLGLFLITVLLKRIIGISLSRLRYDLIIKIARKSMAGQILSGLMILIFTFSIVFNRFEPSMPNFSDALWYCFAITTTIGFGDITAVSGIGRILSVILGIYGIIVVSLITSIIVNFYTEVKDEDAKDENVKDDNTKDDNTKDDNTKDDNTKDDNITNE